MYEEDYSAYPPIQNYKLGFEYVRDANDIFWAILNSICKTFTNSFVLVQIVMGAFINIVIFWFVRKYSSRPYLAILIYFFTLWPLLTFEALRESLSVAFYVFALDALISKKGIHVYYLRVWPAFFFHTFGFLTLFFPLISFIKPSKKMNIIAIVMCFGVLMASSLLSELILPYMTALEIASDKLNMYFESDLYGSNIWSLGGIMVIVLGYILPIGYVAYHYSTSKCDESYKWLYSYLIFMVLVALLKINLPMFYRIFNYFYIVLIVAMTECIREKEQIGFKCARNVKLLTILFVFMVLYGLTKPVGSAKYASIYRYYPYNSIITKDYNKKTESLLPR